MKSALISSLVASVAAGSCPSSPSFIHAQTSVELHFDNSCEMVQEEIVARINANQDGSWADPHNGGTYYLDGVDQGIDAHRLTGTASLSQGGPFEDKIRFSLKAEGSGCFATACSVSQVMSVFDFSGSYCNFRNLVCGSDGGCVVQKHDLTFKEGKVRKSGGASIDASKCIVPVAVEV